MHKIDANNVVYYEKKSNSSMWIRDWVVCDWF